MPLLYGNTNNGYAIIASKGGSPKHPGWFHNLAAQGEVKVKVANDLFEASTRIAEGDERSTIWNNMAKDYPPFTDYQKNAGDREIPVVVLEKK